ncbi:MAG: hypothetical protein EXR72_19860 [Myxococcales bacterium]|nr:hypothetical protein [Myxococcales bacterium]
MTFPARFASRWPKLVIALYLGVTAVASIGLARLRQTDDVLDFIPAGDADVRAFREVSKAFGALQVAVIGIESRPNDDIFSPEIVKKVAEATEALKGVRGVDRVVSLGNLPDFVPSAEMVQVQPLVEGPPATPEARATLKARVMSKEHVVGSFVARDARATLMLVYLAGGGSQRMVAKEVRAVCHKAFGDLRVVYGGAPFAAATIFDETDADIRLLTPIAAFLILGVILITFRDPLGVILAILTVAWSSLVVLGAMGFIGEPYTVVSGTLPVILFASGSSYAVHLLGRYYTDGGGAVPDGPVRAASIVGPPVAIAGLTTSAGFFSFLVMDIRPMRTFGVECGVGVLLCWLAAMTLVPAVVTLWPRKSARPINTGLLGDRLATLTHWAQRRRWPILGAAIALGLATVPPMLRVQVRMEPRAFFSKGSDPYEAERFLEERFGGGQFLQVDVNGDMTDPATLFEIKRMAQFARSLPGVTQVASIVEPLTLVNDAMGGGARLPETRDQVTNLLLFLEGEPSVGMVLAPGRSEALVHIRISGDVQPVVEACEKYLASSLHRLPVAPSGSDVEERLRWIARAAKRTLPPGSVEAAVALMKPLGVEDPRMPPLRRSEALAVLGGDGELMPPLGNGEQKEQIANLVAIADPTARTIFLAAAPSPEEGGLAWGALQLRIHERMRRQVVDAAMGKIGAALPIEALPVARDALADLLPAKAIGKAPRAIQTRLAGEPILDRGFARSVGQNQERSLIVSLVVVLFLMFVLFRSAYLALVSMVSAALWMAAVFGAMGLFDVPIDISTSLVASIATGAGSDFAMHYLWYWKHRTPDEAVRFVGPLMVISALLVSAGFAVLGLGRSQPMRMFGGLAAVAMAGAFALTFLLVPALLRRVDKNFTP